MAAYECVTMDAANSQPSIPENYSFGIDGRDSFETAVRCPACEGFATKIYNVRLEAGSQNTHVTIVCDAADCDYREGDYPGNAIDADLEFYTDYDDFDGASVKVLGGIELTHAVSADLAVQEAFEEAYFQLIQLPTSAACLRWLEEHTWQPGSCPLPDAPVDIVRVTLMRWWQQIHDSQFPIARSSPPPAC